MVFLTKAEADSGEDDDTHERDAAIVMTKIDNITALAAIESLSLSHSPSVCLSGRFVNLFVCDGERETPVNESWQFYAEETFSLIKINKTKRNP